MAKILTDKEALDIIRRAVEEEEIDCSDAYIHFLEGLGALIADHFGGDLGTVYFSPEMNEYALGFTVNECVPADGGVFKKYDTDVTWKDGEET